MQTFLPYADFEKSAQCLDYRRLGKQRVEAWQIYQALTKSDYGWQHHPAVKMWHGHLLGLLHYGRVITQEWIGRGYNDTMLQSFNDRLKAAKGSPTLPKWFGNKDFHDSHKSNLLRKDYEHYKQFGWEVSNNLEYVWPVKG